MNITTPGIIDTFHLIIRCDLTDTDFGGRGNIINVKTEK